MEQRLMQLRQVHMEIEGKPWNFRTDYDDATLEQAREKLELVLREMRKHHPELPTEHIYFLAALNLAAEVAVLVQKLNGLLEDEQDNGTVD